MAAFYSKIPRRHRRMGSYSVLVMCLLTIIFVKHPVAQLTGVILGSLLSVAVWGYWVDVIGNHFTKPWTRDTFAIVMVALPVVVSLLGVLSIDNSVWRAFLGFVAFWSIISLIVTQMRADKRERTQAP